MLWCICVWYSHRPGANIGAGKDPMTSTRRPAVRLTVVPRRVTCPYGHNDGHGGRNLHDCYLDSLTPAHPTCVDPERTGASRCPQASAWLADLGTRTYRVRVDRTTVDASDAPHHEHPLSVQYAPLNDAGTSWYAFNAFTGQRERVTLRPYTLGRTSRVNDDGRAIEQAYTLVDSDELARRIAAGGLVAMPHSTPIWRGVPPIETFRCTCNSCRTTPRRSRDMSDDNTPDDENPNPFAEPYRRRVHGAVPSTTPAPRMAMYGTLTDEERARRAAAQVRRTTPSYAPTARTVTPPKKKPAAPAAPTALTAADVLSKKFSSTTKK